MGSFVIFDHNVHEIEPARQMAAELNMSFFPKLSWGDLYGDEFSPVKDSEKATKASGLPVSSRKEYKEKFGQAYLRDGTCRQLWNAPQINFDGKMLGCCVNHWGNFGDVFEEGFDEVLNGEKMNYARQMLMGKAPARDDIPCTSCTYYKSYQSENVWLEPPPPEVVSRRRQYPQFLYKKFVPGQIKRRIRRLNRLFAMVPSVSPG